MPALIGSSNFGLVGGCLKAMEHTHLHKTTINSVCQCIFPQDPQVQTKLFCKTHVCNACNNHNSNKLSLPFQVFAPSPPPAPKKTSLQNHKLEVCQCNGFPQDPQLPTIEAMMTDQLPKLEKAVEVTTIMHSMLQALQLGAMMTGQLP